MDTTDAPKTPKQLFFKDEGAPSLNHVRQPSLYIHGLSDIYRLSSRRSPDLRGLGVQPDLIQAHNLDELQINLPIHSLFSTKASRGQLELPVSHSFYRWLSKIGSNAGVISFR